MRAFPILYAADVETVSRFYERLGFERVFQSPEEGEAGYVTMRRAESSLGVVQMSFPRDEIGIDVGDRPRSELFVYVEDVDACVAELSRSGARVLREAQDMDWGERIAYVADPEDNPVVLAQGS